MEENNEPNWKTIICSPINSFGLPNDETQKEEYHLEVDFSTSPSEENEHISEQPDGKYIHLTFDLRGAYEAGRDEHPQDIMKRLGITYSHSTPQSLGDCWWFWNCNIKIENCPNYLTRLKITNPLEYVGFGLSEKMALEIIEYPKSW